MQTFISRISLTPSDKKIHFKFNRRQFPLVVSFAMTINKSQGHLLSRVGLYLKDPFFTHGQLYVALSRVKSRNGLKILILDKDGGVTNRTLNVVYKDFWTTMTNFCCCSKGVKQYFIVDCATYFVRVP